MAVHERANSDFRISINSFFSKSRILLFINFLFLSLVLLALRHHYYLLNYIEWGDESETIVVTKMMASGRALFSEIFNHHGPLTFFTGYLLECFLNAKFLEHRLVISFLQILSLISLYFSPLLKTDTEKKIYVSFVLLIIELFLPEYFGHTYIYQVLAGLSLMTILAQFILPNAICPPEVSKRGIRISSFLIGSLPFLAVTYLPVSFLLFISGLRRNNYKTVLIWCVFGVAANIVFLYLTGSIKGYLAYHIYLNMVVLPPYSGAGNLTILRLLQAVYSSATAARFEIQAFCIFLISSLLLLKKEQTQHWRGVLISLGLISLLIRGPHFHSLPFFYSTLALVFIYIPTLKPFRRIAGPIFLGLFFILLIKLSLWRSVDMNKITSRPIPTTTEFAEISRLVTQKNDLVIAYSFENFQYIVADRLPASGYFFYLPWQAKYNEKPVLSIKIDPCTDINLYQPKIMLIDKWKVWDSFPWESYSGCMDDLIREKYIQLGEKPYYLRKDIYEKFNADILPILNRK